MSLKKKWPLLIQRIYGWLTRDSGERLFFLYWDRYVLHRGLFEVGGWALSKYPITQIEVYLDGKKLALATYGLSRPLVGEQHPTLPGSAGAGFYWMGEVPRSLLDKNVHYARIIAYDSHGRKEIAEHEIQGEDLFAAFSKKCETERETLVSKLRKMNPSEWSEMPLFTVVIHDEREDAQSLKNSVQSVLAQASPRWRMGASCNDTGEWLLWLPSGSVLYTDAIYRLGEKIRAQPLAQWVYSDHEIESNPQEFRIKPDWSPESASSAFYAGPVIAFQKKILMGSTCPNEKMSHWIYQSMLKVTDRAKIAHVPHSLYKLSKTSEPSYAPKPTSVSSSHPLVSLLIPTSYKNPSLLDSCLKSLHDRTLYQNLEIIIVENSSGRLTDASVVSSLRGRFPFKIIQAEGSPWNYSRVNNQAAQAARGDYLLFLNDDIEIDTPNWIEELLEWGMRDGVGVVGALLLYPNRTIQHAGMFFSSQTLQSRHWLRHRPLKLSQKQGDEWLLESARNVSAVTFACSLVARKTFDALGGLDEQLRVECNDTDFCLRALSKGYRNVFTPHAMLIHKETATRPRRPELTDEAFFNSRWAETLRRGDPYHNPSLDPEAEGYHPLV